MIKNAIGLHVKYPLFLSDFHENWSYHDRFSWKLELSWQIFMTDFHDRFRKILQYQILQTTVEWEQSCSLRTDSQWDMTKPIFAFPIFVNAPNDSILYIVIHIGPQGEHNVHTCQRPASECYMVIKASFDFRITTIQSDELCGINVEILVEILVVRIVTTRLLRRKNSRVYTLQFKTVFLNRRTAAQYRALPSIIPGRERFSWNLSF